MKNLLNRVLDDEGFELVDMVIVGCKPAKTIRVFIDSEGGVSIKDCAHISRKFSDLMELEGEQSPFNQYRLEVSSPGVDRPLRNEADFNRNWGRTVGVHFKLEGSVQYAEGEILKTDESAVILKTKDGTISVELATIQKAKILLEWK